MPLSDFPPIPCQYQLLLTSIYGQLYDLFGQHVHLQAYQTNGCSKYCACQLLCLEGFRQKREMHECTPDHFFSFFFFYVFVFLFLVSFLTVLSYLLCPLLTLLYGMMNSVERKILGMSSTHFSLANLGIGYPNWTRNLPPKGYPVISIELHRAIFLYLMKFFSHGNVYLLSILLTISKQYCYVHILYANL